jgi:hypothetical protein
MFSFFFEINFVCVLFAEILDFDTDLYFKKNN